MCFKDTLAIERSPLRIIFLSHVLWVDHTLSTLVVVIIAHISYKRNRLFHQRSACAFVYNGLCLYLQKCGMFLRIVRRFSRISSPFLKYISFSSFFDMFFRFSSFFIFSFAHLWILQRQIMHLLRHKSLCNRFYEQILKTMMQFSLQFGTIKSEKSAEKRFSDCQRSHFAYAAKWLLNVKT